MCVCVCLHTNLHEVAVVGGHLFGYRRTFVRDGHLRCRCRSCLSIRVSSCLPFRFLTGRSPIYHAPCAQKTAAAAPRGRALHWPRTDHPRKYCQTIQGSMFVPALPAWTVCSSLPLCFLTVRSPPIPLLLLLLPPFYIPRPPMCAYLVRHLLEGAVTPR